MDCEFAARGKISNVRHKQEKCTVTWVQANRTLSKMTVSTLWAASRMAPPLMSRPFLAPTPVPTITAVGVARPNAQGQATTTTLIADINATK